MLSTCDLLSCYFPLVPCSHWYFNHTNELITLKPHSQGYLNTHPPSRQRNSKLIGELLVSGRTMTNSGVIHHGRSMGAGHRLTACHKHLRFIAWSAREPLGAGEGSHWLWGRRRRLGPAGGVSLPIYCRRLPERIKAGRWARTRGDPRLFIRVRRVSFGTRWVPCSSSCNVHSGLGLRLSANALNALLVLFFRFCCCWGGGGCCFFFFVLCPSNI